MIKFAIPQGTQEEYLKIAAHVNRRILKAVSWFAIAVESANIARVLIFSEMKLGTQNNRIYFGFYLFLLLFSAFYLLAQRRFSGEENLQVQNFFALCSASVFLLWHSLFNVYDVHSAGEMREITVVTALVAFSAVFWMKPICALLNLLCQYLIFIILLRVPIHSGMGVNFTITVILALVIYLARFQHMYEELEQRRRLREANRQLTKTGFWLTREQYELISQTVGFITFQWDIHTDSINFSKEWEEIFGYPSYLENFTDFIRDSEFLRKAQKAEIIDCMANVRKGKSHQTYEMLLPVKSGSEERWFKLQVATQVDDTGAPCYGVGMLDDIMEEKEELFQLKREAQNDIFTGSLNKAAINAYGERALKELQEGQRLAMMIFDMDDFKFINDRYGHPCGDYVIQAVARLLRDYAPSRAKVGRLGGDEFVTMVLVEKDLRHLEAYAGKIQRAMGKLTWGGADVKARCSVGIAVAGDSSWTYNRLYREADKALYKAKENGKNQVCFYEYEGETLEKEK